MALLIAAFSRPFLSRRSAAGRGARRTGAREVVILLDRSASMGYGDHWARAQDEARKIVERRSAARTGRRSCCSTTRRRKKPCAPRRIAAALEAAIDDATVSSEATRYAPALRAGAEPAERSIAAAQGGVLISDFQKTGWERQEEIHLPEGASSRRCRWPTPETSDLAVTSVAIQRAVVLRTKSA